MVLLLRHPETRPIGQLLYDTNSLLSGPNAADCLLRFPPDNALAIQPLSRVRT